MDRGPIQKLLLTQEYEDIEDIVMVESVFVELDKRGDGMQVVSLAITPDRLILGRYHVIDYHDDPELVYDGDRDVSTEGLEIKWLAPLNYIDISHIPNENILKITPQQSRARHFELCTSDPVHSKRVWNKWNNRLGYVTDDPYGYIRRESLRVGEGEVVAEDVKDQSDSDSLLDESERATETRGTPTKQKKKNQDQLPDVKPSQDQLVDVKPNQDQLLEVNPNQDQLLDVKPNQDQLLDVEPNQDQLLDVKSNQDQLLDVKPNQDQLLDVKSNQDQLLDVKPNQDQLLDVKSNQDQLLEEVKPNQDQVLDVKSNQDQLLDVKSNENQLPNVKPDAAKNKKKKKLKKKRTWFTRKK